MQPGIKYGLDVTRIGLAEERVARNLSRVWFLTFARRAVFKNSVFPFVFARPTDRLINDFHLEREALVLFSPYQNFEPRAFDFIDKTMIDFQNRLDKLCLILISQDPEIKSKIRLM